MEIDYIGSIISAMCTSKQIKDKNTYDTTMGVFVLFTYIHITHWVSPLALCKTLTLYQY